MVTRRVGKGERRTWLLLAALVLLMAGFTRSRAWRNDFWEHAAVVRELAQHPWNPRHPLLALETPHAFFSPYALAVGVVTRLTGLPATTVLPWAGMLNLALVLAGIVALSRQVSKRPKRAVFYALLFVLLLWGRDPWRWSGFIHFYGLGSVLPYPSTFSIGLLLVGLAVYGRALREGTRAPILGLIASGALILLTHPTTAISFFAGLVAFHMASPRWRSRREALTLAAILSGSVALAALWPYYDVLDLLRTRSPDFSQSSRALYEQRLEKLWPVALAAPLLLARYPRAPWRDPLILWAGALSAVYWMGAWSGDYGVGRVIAILAICIQLGVADVVARVEHELAARWRWSSAVLPVAVVVALLCLPPRLEEVLATSDPRRDPEPHPTELVAGLVRDNEVVLSDLQTSFAIPAFGGRVVASRHPLYWVPDHDLRRNDLARFFGNGVSRARREQILARWHASYILLNRSRVRLDPRDEAQILAFGRVVAERDGVTLLRVASDSAAHADGR